MAAANPDDPVAVALREALADADLPRTKLAARLDVSTNTVSNWTTGRFRPGPYHAHRLSEELGRPIEVFLGMPLPAGQVQPYQGEPVAQATSPEAIVAQLAELDLAPAANVLAEVGRELDALITEARKHIETQG